MNWHDWIIVASVAVGAFNSWQNKSIELAIEKLRSALVERIARAEGQLDTLKASSGKK